jgi:2'-5' RNA ligase
MSSSGTVGADERLRLFLGFRLPDATARAVAAWQHEQLAVERVRLVPVQNLHVTIAFLGSRPAAETQATGGSSALASTSRSSGGGFRTSPSSAFASALGSSPRSRIWGR